jgi:hypothetical protein
MEATETPKFNENVEIEFNGSPKLVFFSRGSGNAKYGIQTTNGQDSKGGRLFIISNESNNTSLLTIRLDGNLGIGAVNPKEKLEGMGTSLEPEMLG